MSTASIIIIGDEILANKFVDENTPYLLNRCSTLHLDVLSVQIIPDDLDRIASTVKIESERSTYVFTTGGVGPTHDDITFEGVAKAFDLPLERHPTLVSMINQYDSTGTIKEAAYRMADVPKGTELIPTSRGFPQIKIQNVFIFPGVPRLLQSKFAAIEHLLIGREKYHAKVYLNTYESPIASALSGAQDRNPDVNLGSYPRMGETPSLILTVQGYDEKRVSQVKLELESIFNNYLDPGSYEHTRM